MPVRVRKLDGLYGQYLPDQREILIDREVSKDPRKFKETLRHEMVEAALCISGVYWSEIYEQEPVVRALDEIFWPAWERIEDQLKS